MKCRWRKYPINKVEKVTQQNNSRKTYQRSEVRGQKLLTLTYSLKECSDEVCNKDHTLK
jgi:hypothetical protein